MITKCSGVSTDFSGIVPGEAVWMTGHIGVYIGNGKVIECAPSWTNNVQVTACGNIGYINGLNARTWTKHGKLPYITYVTETTTTEEEDEVERYKKLTDVPNDYGFRDVIETLMNAEVIGGDGSDKEGNNDVIDLSEDQVRTIVIEYRGGAFDRVLISKGKAPVVALA